MAAATTILAGAAIVGGGIKAIDGAKRAKQAQNDIDNYQRQDLVNHAENSRISTLGSELMVREQQRRDANIIDSIQSGGVRALGKLGMVQSNANRTLQSAGADLDKQFVNRQQNITQGAFRVQQMQERREEADLQGLGNALNVGRQDMWNGIDGAVNGAAFALGGMGGGATEANPQQQTVGQVSMQGATQLGYSGIGTQNNMSGFDAGYSIDSTRRGYSDNYGIGSLGTLPGFPG